MLSDDAKLPPVSFATTPRHTLATTAETLSGRVVRVVDGDTVYVVDAGREQRKIRLGGIDTPERGRVVDESVGNAHPVTIIAIGAEPISSFHHIEDEDRMRYPTKGSNAFPPGMKTTLTLS